MPILETARTALRSQYAYLVLGLLGVGAMLSTAYWLGWLGTMVGSPWFYALLSLLSGLGVFAGIRWGIPWVQERRFVRKESSEYVAAGEESPEEFSAKFSKALQMLQSMPQLKGKANPLYALPWYLLIGDAQSGKTAALRATEMFSPLFPPSAAESGTQNYDWWISNAAVFLDTAGRYAQPVDPSRDRTEWYRLLRLLHHHRSLEPINGLVITVAADWLATQPEEKLRADASKLRDRLEEAVRELGVDFPVYLLVAKCDVIEGFAEFFRQLPERMRNEVLGYVDDPRDGGQQRGAAALQRIEAGLRSIYERLHFYRMSILDGKPPEALHQAIFCFPEEFKALQRPLMTFVEPLFNEDVRYHTPLLRALFLTSAQQPGTRLSLLRRELKLGEETTPVDASSTPYFLSDLFDSILPRDRALVSATPREHRRRGLGRALRVTALLGGILLVAVLGIRAFVIDRRIAASVNPAACPEEVPKVASTPRLDGVARCRQAVENLADGNRQRSRWSTWVFNRSGRLEDTLRERYARQFKSELLAPLNSEIDRSFQVSSDPLPLMLLLARRIQLDRRCLSPAGCSERSAEDLQPDYPLMLSPKRDRRASANDVASLKQTYTAYVVWQRGDKEYLQQDLADDQKRLRQWLSAKQFSLDNLLPLVNKRSPPITYDNYWELPALVATVTAPQVEAACTKKVWEQDVAPFLQQLQDAVPDATPQLRNFQKEYYGTCLMQWQRFLAGFAQGAQRWKGPDQERTLALRLLTQESPCNRIIEEAVANLAPWLPADADSAGTPGWASRLRRYATSEQRTAYQDALKKISARLERGSLPEVCFKLAQEAFTEGKPTQESTNPVLHAWWAASQAPPDGGAALKPDDGVLKPLLEEPLRYVWRVILAQAASHLQTAWADNVIAPLKGLPPAEQVVMLYGPGGKVGMFGEQFLRPFLTGEEPRVTTVMGESLPLSPQFVQVMSNAKELKSVLEGGGTPQPVMLTAPRRSDIESRSSFLGEQTIFSVTCTGKAYRVTNRPQQPDESSTAVPWSSQACGDVTLTIFFFAGESAPMQEVPAGAKRFQLTKTYGGRTAFLQFLQDFASGSHRFRLDDLYSTDPEVLRSGVNAITVYYQVEVPPTLTKLVSALQDATPPDQIVAPSAS